MFQSALFSQKKTKEEHSGLRPNLVLISYKKNQTKQKERKSLWHKIGPTGGRGPKQKKHGNGTTYEGRYLSFLVKSEATATSF